MSSLLGTRKLLRKYLRSFSLSCCGPSSKTQLCLPVSLLLLSLKKVNTLSRTWNKIIYTLCSVLFLFLAQIQSLRIHIPYLFCTSIQSIRLNTQSLQYISLHMKFQIALVSVDVSSLSTSRKCRRSQSCLEKVCQNESKSHLEILMSLLCLPFPKPPTIWSMSQKSPFKVLCSL